MRITTAADLGQAIRHKRKTDRLTLEEAAALCGVSYAFLSALENGKETVRLNKVLRVLQGIGLELDLSDRGWTAP